MKLLLTFLLLLSTSILIVNSLNFLNPFGHAANKFCYIKVNVPVTPYKFYMFRDWSAKIAANQDLYDQRAHIGMHSKCFSSCRSRRNTCNFIDQYIFRSSVGRCSKGSNVPKTILRWQMLFARLF